MPYWLFIILVPSLILSIISIPLIYIYYPTRKDNIEESFTRKIKVSIGSTAIPFLILVLSNLVFNLTTQIFYLTNGEVGERDVSEVYISHEKYKNLAIILFTGIEIISSLIFIFKYDKKNRTIASIIMLIIICAIFYFLSVGVLSASQHDSWLR